VNATEVLIESKHNRTHSSVFIHTNSVSIQGNITAMRYRNDAIRSVLLLHIDAFSVWYWHGTHHVTRL